ncbi:MULTISPECIES: hypothetical protein [unclassified Sporosarcina]|uniref:hypothetical protein n=1 Tax=unclassified Sporosarcina TaxID=2647733 RepID=UPI000C16A6E7|nr:MULTISPECIES: hypothetical protein [unclassified Sporosarcina]PID05865.1 hypothetical protein CSV66_07695 [Sporosarcina sp. P30]PID09059.1 hypothetical protein CSV65_07695 [Sporosarcina sp. P31]PID12356.1 hypothetical protein CSV64_07165 [Sporosarcina sp. P32b]
MNKKKVIEDIVQEVLNQLGKSKLYGNDISLPLLYVHQADDEAIQMLKKKWEVTDDLKESVDHVLFCAVSQNTLVKGALGLADDPCSKLLATFLLNGKKVTMIPSKDLEWLLHSDKKDTPYTRHLLAYKEQLEKFGVQFVRLNEFTMLSTQEKSPSVDKLLTEKIVKSITSKNIFVRRATIVTPLARDTAKELGKVIKVIE